MVEVPADRSIKVTYERPTQGVTACRGIIQKRWSKTPEPQREVVKFGCSLLGKVTIVKRS